MATSAKIRVEVKKVRKCLSGISDTCYLSFKTTKHNRVCVACTHVLEHVWEQKVKLSEDKDLKEFWSKLK